MLFEVTDLSVYYGAARALDNVSLRIDAGELVSVIGANGAGKSTLLKTISGFVKGRAGRILFEGKEITHLRPEEIVRAGIVQVPEHRRVFPGLTVFENLEVGTASWRRLGGSYKRELDQVLTLFPRLAERKNQRAWSLSGGEQQMVSIGRALMARPKLLLMDEPSLGLAPMIVSEVMQVVREINRQGTPVLLVEQNAILALQNSQRGYVLANGSVTLEGTGSELLENEAVQASYLGTRSASEA